MCLFIYSLIYIEIFLNASNIGMCDSWCPVFVFLFVFFLLFHLFVICLFGQKDKAKTKKKERISAKPGRMMGVDQEQTPSTFGVDLYQEVRVRVSLLFCWTFLLISQGTKRRSLRKTVSRTYRRWLESRSEDKRALLGLGGSMRSTERHFRLFHYLFMIWVVSVVGRVRVQ